MPKKNSFQSLKISLPQPLQLLASPTSSYWVGWAAFQRPSTRPRKSAGLDLPRSELAGPQRPASGQKSKWVDLDRGAKSAWDVEPACVGVGDVAAAVDLRLRDWAGLRFRSPEGEEHQGEEAREGSDRGGGQARRRDQSLPEK